MLAALRYELFWTGLLGTCACWALGRVAEAEMVRWLKGEIDHYIDHSDTARRDSLARRTWGIGTLVPAIGALVGIAVATRDSIRYRSERTARQQSTGWAWTWWASRIGVVVCGALCLVGGSLLAQAR